MIADGTLSVLGAWGDFRKGNFPGAARHLGLNWRDVLSGRWAANQWLAYQYGWKPLVQSVHDNVKLLDGHLRGDGATFSVQRTIKADYQTSSQEWSNRIDWRCFGGCRVGLKAKVSNAFVSNLDTAGVINPLSIAWELTPYSFVVDWFIPVGNVLSALSDTLGLEFLDGYQSYSSNRVRTRTMLARAYSGTSSLLNPGKEVIHLFRTERTPLSGFPLPQLYAKKNPFSTTHIVSAISLIRSSIR
jgi:hypothetical protein